LYFVRGVYDVAYRDKKVVGVFVRFRAPSTNTSRHLMLFSKLELQHWVDGQNPMLHI
jgi:hypothetical protein